jgi:5-(carboxyamino)imidazole ribonucleotide synthase
MANQFKLGIIGGGQLALMALPTLHRYQINTFILADAEDPCAQVDARCYIGSPTNYQDVLSFGKKCTHVTVEIENVNIEALEELEHLGVDVCPNTDSLKLIRDKKKQKEFYLTHEFPCARFASANQFPVIQKVCVGGYDGKGVKLIQTAQELKNNPLPGETYLEEKINIKKELAVIIARNRAGEISLLPPVEMVFNKKLNLLDFLVSPANISEEVVLKLNEMATSVATKIKLEGLLAIEFFETLEGEILINEMAPRPHNSGHHTIEANSI